MKSLFIILTFVLSSSILAGPGGGHSHGHSHDHSKKAISQEQAKILGKKEIAKLVKKGKLDASWNKANFTYSEKKKFGKRTEWVLSYENKKGVKGVKGVKGKKLYVFLTLSGKFIAANFTGK